MNPNKIYKLFIKSIDLQPEDFQQVVFGDFIDLDLALDLQKTDNEKLIISPCAPKR